MSGDYAGRSLTLDADLLQLRSIGLGAANQFLARLDPAYQPVRHHTFALALEDPDGSIRGIAIAGPPSDRHLDTGWRLEILHVTTDNTPNARLRLLAATAKAAVTVGYRPQDIVTCTPAPGTSLRTADWVPAVATTAASRARPGRRRTDRCPTSERTRWQAAPSTAQPQSRGCQR
jgi:hypothetical protein